MRFSGEQTSWASSLTPRRLIGMMLAEQNDEWQLGRRYKSLETLSLLRIRVLEGSGNALPEAVTALPQTTQAA